MEIFDLDSVQSDFQGEILTGLMGEASSVMLRMFPPMNVASQSGTIPILPSSKTLGSDHPSENSEIAIDAKPTKLSGGLNNVAFNFDRKFSAEGNIHRMQVEQLARAGVVNSAEDVLNIVYAQAVIQIASDIDRVGKALLDALATTQAATAVWSDSTNARPVTDLDALIFDTVPGADFVWLGHTEARELAKLPAITAMFNQFNGVDATASFRAVAAWIQDRYEVPDVMIGGGWYNAEADPVAISKTRRFDGQVIAGKRSHIATAEFEALRETNQGYHNDGSQIYFGNVTAYVDQNESGEAEVARLTGF